MKFIVSIYPGLLKKAGNLQKWKNLKNIKENKKWWSVMRFGIIGAMDEEIEYLRNIMTETKEHEIASVLLIEGKLAGKEVILLKSGIGKVNAAMATTILIERFQPTHVINTGTAGGMKGNLNVGDVVVGDEIVHHDVDVTAFDYKFGQVPNMP